MPLHKIRYGVLNNSEELLAVFLHLTERTILRCCRPEYQEIWHSLLMEMKQTATLIFVYEDNLLGKFSSLEEKLSEWRYDTNLASSLFEHYYKKFEEEGALKVLEEIRAQTDKAELLVETVQREGLKAELFIREVKLPRDIASLLLGLLEAVKTGRDQLLRSTHKEPERVDQLLRSTHKELERSELLVETIHRIVTEQVYEEVQKAKQLLKDIQVSGVEVVPYKKNAEITVRIQQFLDETENGVFLHIYIPDGRFQADQLASFLRIFENYLQRVEKLDFAIDLKKTKHGLVYLFKSKGEISTLTDMEEAFTRFGIFMDLCQSDPKRAETILAGTGISSTEASNVVSKYIKGYQRLILDTRHELEQKSFEFEQKKLALRQRLESEAFEVTNGNIVLEPQTVQPYAFLSFNNNSGAVNINILNPTVNNNAITDSIINGDINYTSKDKQLIELFQKYTEGLEVIRLKSELEQLKDTSSPEDIRKTAKQKVVGFLYKVAPAIGQTALTVLTAYLEKLLTGA